MKRPCLDCGIPSDQTRCARCRPAFEAGRDVNGRRDRRRKQQGGRPQYKGDYQRRGEGVRAIGICWICGQPGRPDDPIQADHLQPAATHGGRGGEGGLAPAHRSCNIRRAQEEARARRKQQRRAEEKAELDRRLRRHR